MFRFVLLCAVFGAAMMFAPAPSASGGDKKPAETRVLPPEGDKQPEAPTKTVIKLALHPMPEPIPVNRYCLIPPLSKTVPGNPVQGFMKCFAEQNYFYFHKETVEERIKLNESPLAALKGKNLKHYGGSSLRHADDAARMDRPDWQLLHRLREDGISTLLPDVQMMRQIADANRVRIRGAIAEGRLDDAIAHTSTTFAVSRIFEVHPTLIGNLVGLALVGVGLGTTEELISQPGAPNLYWALAELPDPMISLRSGLQGERILMDKEFSRFEPSRVLTKEELASIMEGFAELFKHEKNSEALLESVTKRASDAKFVEAALKRLVASGLKQEQLKRLLPLQIVLLDDQREYQIRSAEILKWGLLPFHEAEKRRVVAKDQKDSLFCLVVPKITKAERAKARMQQRLAMLMIAEAIRAHAATKKELPKKLEELQLYVPKDAINGKEFAYRVVGETAFLEGAAPKGEEKNPYFNVVYAMTLVAK